MGTALAFFYSFTAAETRVLRVIMALRTLTQSIIYTLPSG